LSGNGRAKTKQRLKSQKQDERRIPRKRRMGRRRGPGDKWRTRMRMSGALSVCVLFSSRS